MHYLSEPIEDILYEKSTECINKLKEKLDPNCTHVSYRQFEEQELIAIAAFREAVGNALTPLKSAQLSGAPASADVKEIADVLNNIGVSDMDVLWPIICAGMFKYHISMKERS